jgi:hypothetical protein
MTESDRVVAGRLGSPQQPDERRLVLHRERDDVEDSEVNLMRPVFYGAV